MLDHQTDSSVSHLNAEGNAEGEQFHLGFNFAPVPLSVLYDDSLRNLDKLIFGRLILYAGRNGKCCPAHETLASRFHVTVRCVIGSMYRLRKEDYISWTRTGRTNYYTINFEKLRRESVDIGARRSDPIRTNVHIRSEQECIQKEASSDVKKEKKEQQRPVICAPTPQPQPKPPATQNPDVRTRNLLRPDDERPKTYASPKDELIAICRRHVPQPPTIAGWDRVEVSLAASGVSVADFVARVRSEIISGKIKIADAFLLSRAREFARTAEIRPVEAVPAAPERCPICKEIKGHGTLYPKMPDGSVRYVACECATPEWRRKVEAMQVEALARARAAQGGREMAMLG